MSQKMSSSILEDNLVFDLTSSVSNAMRQVGTEKRVSAGAFAQAIFRLHGEYAGGRAASLQLQDTPSELKARDWVDETQILFDPDRIRSFSKSDKPPELHGRLLVIGLSLLEPRLREQLEGAGVFTALAHELQEPLPEILTERGRDLYDSWEKVRARNSPELYDTVPNWSDDPLLRPDQDLLGRHAFARFLAKRIDFIKSESHAYSIHIYGPWGSGKSTLLNFLRNELEPKEKESEPREARRWIAQLWNRLRKRQRRTDEQDWLVVEFNAWRHQQIKVPWWSLMERILKETKNRLTPWGRFLEYWWRFNSGRLQYFLVFIVLAWLLALVVFPLISSEAHGGGLKAFAEGADNISKILALIATIWGGIFAINRSLLFGSAQAAQNYTDLTHDPANEIKRRFNGLIEKLQPARAVILVDDLDRCQSSYVVELLEGVQTLFREAPVVFVVAADRQWLNACYEEVYEKLKLRVQEPGKPLGALFLEKAFRFSTPMPGIPEKLKEHYWQYLLRVSTDQLEKDMSAARAKAKDQLAEARTESKIRHRLNTSSVLSFPEQRALREEAAVLLASPEIIERIEHTLKPYGALLDTNPRAMKLLVNGYSANRALAILSEVDIDLHQLALWTILSSRWPRLADYLTEHPDMLERIGQEGIEGLPEDLKALWKDPDVREVVKGGSTHTALRTETLEHCVRLRS
ncbi:MAG TPA: P-loop NTPase fold protein [Blastocatellia bacterium]|nr:P-loop NTPase fold protein [Blastocatellia bacterium]